MLRSERPNGSISGGRRGRAAAFWLVAHVFWLLLFALVSTRPATSIISTSWWSSAQSSPTNSRSPSPFSTPVNPPLPPRRPAPTAPARPAHTAGRPERARARYPCASGERSRDYRIPASQRHHAHLRSPGRTLRADTSDVVTVTSGRDQI